LEEPKIRCLSCDKRLNDRESVRKYSSSGTFVDLCDRCFATVSEDIPDIEEGDFPSDLDEGDEEDYQQQQQHYFGDSSNDRE
jgi:hypothetical protein